MKPNWPLHPLGELAQLRSGGTPARSIESLWNGTVPWFSGKDLKSFFLSDSIEHVTRTAVAQGARTVPSGTLLILVRGMALMKSVPLGITACESTFNQDVKALLPNPEKIDAVFLGYYLVSQEARLRGLVTTAGHGTGRLPLEALEEYPTPVPPLQEQRKIAASLSTWDQTLEQLAALIRAKERRKTALMQQLLTGRRRLRGFAGKWTMARLGDLADEVAIPNRGRLGTERLYAVTKADGMVPMREHVKGASIQRCNLVERDWFAYNPMRINIGSLARWRGSDPVMVSPDYVVFRCNPAKLIPGFLDHLRRSWRWKQFVAMAGDGSVRVRIYFDRLAEFAFPCPPLPEQEAIAAILDTCDEELRLLRAQRAAVDHQKRGLMQQLLTGRIRVRY